MPFVKFAETARSYRPKVSIRANGTLGFSSGAVAKFQLKDYKYAVLHYDEERRMVGVKPVKTDEEGAHAINRGKTGAWIAARRFLDYFSIATNATKKFEANWDEKEKMIVFQVS
jgi:hypothetical protein